MAVRATRRLWTQQPQEAVRANTGAFPGIQRLYLPLGGGLLDVARNVAVPAVFSSTAAIALDQVGYGLSVPTTGSVRDVDDDLPGVGSSLTAWLYLRPRSRTASDFLFGRFLSNRAASGTGYSFGLYWAATGAQAYLRNASGTVVSTAAVAITTNVPQLWALTYDGTTLRAYVNSATASAAQTGAVRSSANEDIAFGGWGTSPTVAFDAYAAGIDNTVYSADQIKALSENPWSAFEPKRIWVPVAAAAGTSLTPGVGSITITGYAPSVAQSNFVSLTPGAGSVAITGYAPAVTRGTTTSVLPGVGSIAFTGYAPTVTQSGATNVTPGAGSLSLTGYAPTVAQTASISLVPGAGSVTITGHAPTVLQAGPISISPGVGSLSITGYAPTITQGAPMTTISIVQPYITVYFWKRTA